MGAVRPLSWFSLLLALSFSGCDEPPISAKSDADIRAADVEKQQQIVDGMIARIEALRKRKCVEFERDEVAKNPHFDGPEHAKYANDISTQVSIVERRVAWLTQYEYLVRFEEATPREGFLYAKPTEPIVLRFHVDGRVEHRRLDGAGQAWSEYGSFRVLYPTGRVRLSPDPSLGATRVMLGHLSGNDPLIWSLAGVEPQIARMQKTEIALERSLSDEEVMQRIADYQQREPRPSPDEIERYADGLFGSWVWRLGPEDAYPAEQAMNIRSFHESGTYAVWELVGPDARSSGPTVN